MTENAMQLTARERQVLELVGLRDDDIAERPGIAPSTVALLLRSAMAKVGARTRVDAASRAGGDQRMTIHQQRRLQMHFTRKLALALVLAVVAIAALATSASAATVPAEGQFIEGREHVIDEQQVGDDWCYIKRNVTVTGTYSGKAHFTELVIIEPDGTTHLYGVMEFFGTACGEQARLEFVVTGHGCQVEGFIDGTYVVHGTGRDAGEVVGGGTFTGVPGTVGDYVGTADC